MKRVTKINIMLIKRGVMNLSLILFFKSKFNPSSHILSCTKNHASFFITFKTGFCSF